MNYSKIEMTGKETNWYIEILMWCKDNAIVWGSFGLGWKALDLGFKYLKDGREATIRNIVQDEISKGVGIKIDNLSNKIEDLGNAVFKLNTKL